MSLTKLHEDVQTVSLRRPRGQVPFDIKSRYCPHREGSNGFPNSAGIKLLASLSSTTRQTATALPATVLPTISCICRRQALCTENEGYGNGARGWSEIGGVLRVVEEDGEAG